MAITANVPSKVLLAAITIPLLATGCTSEASEKEPPGTVPAEEVCGGLTPKGAKALEDITETERFDKSSRAVNPQRITQEVSPATGKESPWLPREYCSITPTDSTKSTSPRLTFETTEEPPSPPDKPRAGEKEFSIALRAASQRRSANIYFDCKRRLDQRTSEHTSTIIKGRLEYGYPGSSRDDVMTKNMQVLQDVSYKLAKHLKCRDNGGIPKL